MFIIIYNHIHNIDICNFNVIITTCKKYYKISLKNEAEHSVLKLIEISRV